MTLQSAIVSFALVAGLVTIIPGLDTALVLRAALTQGRRAAFATALGVSTGALIWGAGAAAGVSALLVASSRAYTAVRVAGAVYLIWFGVRLLTKAIRDRGTPALEPVSRQSAGLWRAWSRGLLTNLLNPKIGAFYVAVLPQFIPAHTSHLAVGALLALVHDLEALVWFSAIIFAAGAFRDWLSRRSVRRVVDGLTGTALIGFGVKLSLSAK